MVNRILAREEMTFPASYYEENPFYIVLLNGEYIRSREAFFKAMETNMKFPGTCMNKFSRFDDWMKDLSWISEEMGICIIINNYQKFLSEDKTFKENVMSDFRDDILPFWQEGVLRYVKGGKQRRFDIVLN